MGWTSGSPGLPSRNRRQARTPGALRGTLEELVGADAVVAPAPIDDDVVGVAAGGEPRRPSWTWLAPETRAKGKARAARGKALTLTTFDAGGGRVLGSVRLEGNVLVLTANSVERAERGRERLREALGARVGVPLTSLQTAEQALAERQATGGGDVAEAPPLPPEEVEAIMRETLDQHYRGILSRPVSMLDGKSPRQAARSKAGRRKVAEWLKYLENQTAHRAAGGGMPAYDFGWMWEELKIADLRR